MSEVSVLLIEDDEDDALLVVRALRATGFRLSYERVWTRDALAAALAAKPWDVVISDFNMPDFDAPRALALVRQHSSELPFIIVSGTVGEEDAVRAIKAGANDYLMKDRLSRLGASVQRELEEARRHREYVLAQKRAQQALLEKQIAEAENEATRRFYANLSHELRSPLNAVIGYAELMQQGVAGPSNALQTEFVGHIVDAGRHLLQVANDILDTSRIEAGRMELARQRVSVAEIATFVSALFLPEARQCGVELSYDVPSDLPPISADPMRMRQILCNLVSNAIKFTPRGRKVWVTAQPRERTGVEVRVKDEGIGIGADDLPRLFHEFERLGDSSQQHRIRGTGLGLSLTKRLVELHGGSIRAESEPGCGSTFAVVLPRAD
jgi:two-component system sensor histidine kinase EvgS